MQGLGPKENKNLEINEDNRSHAFSNMTIMGE